MSLLQKWISPKYLHTQILEAYKKNMFASPYVKSLVFDGFLLPEIAEKLKEEIEKSNKEREFHFNETYLKTDNSEYVKAGVDFYFYTSPLLRELNMFLNSQEFMKYLSFLYAVEVSYTHKDVEYTMKSDEDYGTGDFDDTYTEEAQVKHFPDIGITFQDNSNVQDLGWHTDYETDNGVRKAGNVLLYLTTDTNYSPEKGGHLELGKKEDEGIVTYQTIAPDFNRFAMLIAEKDRSYHRIGNFKQPYQRRAFVKQVFFA